MKKAFILLLFIPVLFPALSYAQKTKNFIISGYIRDTATNETLMGANIYIASLQKGAVTDINGYYTIALPEGKHTLRISYVGYATVFKQIDLRKNERIDFLLVSSTTLNEVVITSTREEANVQNTDGSKIELPIKKLETLPVLFGEADILKTIQLMPGIQSGGEGSNGFYVRGGGPDQNLILLDGATVYNASHLMGFFSVFNSDAISSAEIIKGGMPAEFGGRAASVLNITTKEGNMNRYEGEAGIGLISSRLSFQGPIVKDKASFQISGRRTYVDVLMKPFSKGSDFEGLGYYFYDVNAKLNYRISPKDNLTFTGYYGQDVFNLKDAGISMDWGNALASLRWTHFFSDNFLVNTTASFIDYECNIGMNNDIYKFKLFSGVRDINGKIDFSYLPNASNKIKWGVDYTLHRLTPSSASASSNDVELDLGTPAKLWGHEGAAYALHEFQFGTHWKVNYGLRFSYFAQMGPFVRYQVNNLYDMVNIDSTVYGSREIVADYWGLEPRINIRYQLTKKNSIKASYTRNYQYIHLATMSSASLPTDAWFPSTSLVQPQCADQVTLGYFQNFLENTLETSLEIYYKKMTNLIEYRDGAKPSRSIQTNADYDFAFGDGQSYGAELFINKTVGKLTGWLGYTLSWTTRSFPDIMDGKTFYSRYDRRHDISLVLTYELSKKWVLSSVWVYATGNAQTLPVSYYIIDNTIITEWGERNSWRMPAYHRLDLSATWYFIEKKRWKGNLNFSVYNVYNRMNPYFINFEQEVDLEVGTLKTTPKQVSIFPILPSVTLNIKFK